jgi:hypothetical protein
VHELGLTIRANNVLVYVCWHVEPQCGATLVSFEGDPSAERPEKEKGCSCELSAIAPSATSDAVSHRHGRGLSIGSNEISDQNPRDRLSAKRRRKPRLRVCLHGRFPAILAGLRDGARVRPPCKCARCAPGNR